MRFRRRIGLEAAGKLRLKFGLVALWVYRRMATLGRRKYDVGSCILECVVRSGEFFESKAGFLARVA